VSETTRTFWAPGRLNLIGEFTDLSGGLVLPVGLQLGVRIEAQAADVIRLRSRDLGGEARLRPDGRPIDGGAGWSRYVSAVAGELARLGRPPVGLVGEITSTLPIGTGLSSSAALEVAVAVALCAVSDFCVDAVELAQAARRAEHRAVGVPCGIMDQAASLLAKAGHALLLDTSSLDYEHVALPAELGLVVVYSGVARRLEDSAYGVRQRELAEAMALVSAGGSDLRTLSVDEVDELGLSPVLARRLRHVVSENDRVREVVRLLRAFPTRGSDRLGDVFRAAHESLRRDFEVTTRELDLLVDLAYEAGALAARMTGGGFGGSIVALVEADHAQTLADAILMRYVARGHARAWAAVCVPSDGAREER
jgi:galactokinase